MRERKGGQLHRNEVRDGPFQSHFKEYAKILDEKSEKRERLVKASRDVTLMSKKLIFALHRIKQETRDAELKEASETAARIRRDIASRIGNEVDESNYYIFHRAFSPGLQEYIEARTFLAFLQDGTLLSLEALQEEIHHARSENQVRALDVDATDYLLGIADLTGELMRCAIAKGSESTSIYAFLKDVENAFVNTSTRYSLRVRDLNGKISVMRTSVGKVERSCFDRVVRDAEMGDVDE